MVNFLCQSSVAGDSKTDHHTNTSPEITRSWAVKSGPDRNMSSDGDFDDFVDELGGFGKYQKRLLYLLLCKCEG